MGWIETIAGFLGRVLAATLAQLGWGLGLVLAFGLLLYGLAWLTRRAFVKAAGPKADAWATGWIGVPVHELGHVVFCLLFRHRILEVRLFRPDARDGTLGYVRHSYDRRSLYQRVGTFFIGIGPILLGSLVLYVLLHALVPHRELVAWTLERQEARLESAAHGNVAAGVQALGAVAGATLRAIVRPENLADPRVWIFLYLAMAIASHLELSPADLRGAGGGLLVLVGAVLLLNVLLEILASLGLLGSWWDAVAPNRPGGLAGRAIGTLGALLAFATALSALTFALSWAALNAVHLARGRGWLVPWR